MLTSIRNFDFYDVHVKGAESIARIAADNGVENFIHVSHLNAAENSPSQFYASKYEGEQVVREIYPTATIVRPGAMYGHEDRLLINMASKSTLIYGLLGVSNRVIQNGESGGNSITARRRFARFM